MTLSIRRFLLINLLFAIVLITVPSIIGDYYINRLDINDHMDALLEQVALSFHALVTGNTDPKRLSAIQNQLNLITEQAMMTSLQPHEPAEQNLMRYNKYYFQLFDKNGKLLLHSANAVNLDLNTNTPGFSDLIDNYLGWRVFMTIDPQTQLKFIVGERYDVRKQLIHRIAQDDIYILFFTFPLTGLVIWLVIGLSLRSLQKIAEEVSNRAPNYLEPVDIKEVPEEILPLIDELNKLFLQLHQAFEREKRFAADAAHELRTPLAALKTQAQVALKTKDDTERQNLLHNVILGVDRSAHIVQQLLTLSRLVPEASSIEDLTEVNLVKVTAETIAQIAPMAIEKNIDIELKAPDQPVNLMGNITALRILIRNLVDNAIRYTPQGGMVRVAVITEPQAIVLRVTDTGPGIPAELRSRVFERFYRVLGSTSSGSGLGLAIVQQIARLHQAEVKLGSPANGIGLQVEVSFPYQ